ncbi:beta-ketoacyl-ACP synthase III [Candidatus Enterococcus ferrettii]|uniref:Beta-ketoacyl-[acyl-carrier-protein] synthase III n=1 Tax=Candidatus Enterococcus ferrettii TaxID=2815324 RepID=A0ABV0EVZ5_9ENTE|nr:beta-ketoacyl-ACP synthase III [Enterococcus sp. 665A]MBO1339903.1 ketoacyl-ACP synthase III [Enterococcus sp. 665A]
MSIDQYGKITATARYLPNKIVTNDELAQWMDTSDEWIQSRTGIKQRHIAEEENTSDLCTEVAQKLLAKAQLDASSLDFIIVATMSPDYSSPSVACQVQGRIGARQAMAFDLTAACAGFVYALATGENFIRTGLKRGIVIGGEKTSKLINWEDRSTAVLFGDGAAGVLLEAENKPSIIRQMLRADGERANSLVAGFRPTKTKFYQDDDQSGLTMDGRGIWNFALNDVVEDLQAFVGEDPIDLYLFHQANRRIIEKMAKKLKEPIEKFPMNLTNYGNTSAASIPILLDELVEADIIHLNGSQKVVLTGYGGGLAWGNLLLEL